MSELFCAWHEPPPNIEALKAMGLSDEQLRELCVLTVRPVISSFVNGDTCFVVVDFEGGAALDVSKVQLQTHA